MLYVPVGFAHGFQTLEDETDVTYQVSHPYTPGGRGRPALGRPGLRHRLAAAGRGDLREGRGLAAARIAICDVDPGRADGHAFSGQGFASVTIRQGPGSRIVSHPRFRGRPNRVSSVTLPNFLIIGAPKAGTTSLYDYLRPHPEIFMPYLKEPRFFCYRGQDNLYYYPVRTLAAYEALYDGVTDRDGDRRERRRFYFDVAGTAERIHAVIPETRDRGGAARAGAARLSRSTTCSSATPAGTTARASSRRSSTTRASASSTTSN